MAIKYWQVPKLWPGETVVIVGSGESLTQEQVTYARGRARVIAINDNYLLAPWADIHYFCDKKWYDWHYNFESNSQKLFGKRRAMNMFHSFAGLRVALESAASRLELEPSIKILRNGSHLPDGKVEIAGLCTERDGVRTGRNSVYQCMNLSVHLGVKKIILIGVDCTGNYWFGKHPNQSGDKHYENLFPPHFKTLAPLLKGLGIEVVNCSHQTILECFRRDQIENCI